MKGEHVLLTEKLKNAAEKAMPAERKFADKLKSRRLIVSGITSVILLFPIYRLMLSYNSYRFYVLLAFLGVAELTAAGTFFANIRKFSMMKFVVATAVCSAVLYVSVNTLSIVVGMDLTRIGETAVILLGRLMFGLPVCATVTALISLSVYFTIFRKTKE